QELSDGDVGVGVVAARGEEVGEEGLEDREPLGRDRARRTLGRRLGGRRRCELAWRLRRRALVPVAHATERGRDLAPQLVRLERDRAAVLLQHPRREPRQRRVLGDEDAVLEAAGGAVGALHPPGGLAGNLDARLADDGADLPRRTAAVGLDVELRRRPEVTLAARREL